MEGLFGKREGIASLGVLLDVHPGAGANIGKQLIHNNHTEVSQNLRLLR